MEMLAAMHDEIRSLNLIRSIEVSEPEVFDGWRESLRINRERAVEYLVHGTWTCLNWV